MQIIITTGFTLCLLAVIGHSEGGFIMSYNPTGGRDGGGRSSSYYMSDDCRGFEELPTEQIVHVVGCFNIYATDDCTGASEELKNAPLAAYSFPNVNSATACEESEESEEEEKPKENEVEEEDEYDEDEDEYDE